MRIKIFVLLTFLCIFFCNFLCNFQSAFATTKGLSQIVTPDLQKPADLSLSFQAQDSAIGNPYQLQAELGITPYFEAAVFQGFSPGEVIFAAEAGLIQHGPYLLSTGFLNYSTRGDDPQPFLEGGYYTEHDKWMIGPIYTSQLELLLGWAHDFNAHWRFQIDFQSGSENFSTVGFTYTLNDSFQINPAVFIPNSGDTEFKGYCVVTYTFPAWRN